MKAFERAGLILLIALSLICTGCGGQDDATVEQSAAEQSAAETPVIQITKQETQAGPDRIQEAETETENETGDSVPDPDKSFYITEITDEVFARMEGKSFKADCTLPREDLRYLHVLHKTLSGESEEGELVVNVHIADETLAIFKELYDAGYPIEKIRLVDEYDADDDRSMADNNTSCFNFRTVAGTNRISKHGRGLAIDLNPLYNPYVTFPSGSPKVSPENGAPYADRSGDYPYKIDEDDLAYKVFTEHGFVWGGAWKNEKDYQHFEIPSGRIKEWYPE